MGCQNEDRCSVAVVVDTSRRLYREIPRRKAAYILVCKGACELSNIDDSLHANTMKLASPKSPLSPLQMLLTLFWLATIFRNEVKSRFERCARNVASFCQNSCAYADLQLSHM